MPSSLRPAVLLVLLCWALATPAVPAAAAAEPAGVWPLEPQPEVVHGFDPPAVRWGAGHRGVDLAGRLGQPVRAALGGTVSYAGRVAGRGVVVVDHGSTRTTYQPVTATVSVGDEVDRGDRLGRLAFFGSHCLPGTCLHWGLIEGVATYLDPLALVGGGPRPVRLLPPDGGPPRLAGPASAVTGAHAWSPPVPAVGELLRSGRLVPPPAGPVVVAVAVAGAVRAVGAGAAG